MQVYHHEDLLVQLLFVLKLFVDLFEETLSLPFNLLLQFQQGLDSLRICARCLEEMKADLFGT